MKVKILLFICFLWGLSLPTNSQPQLDTVLFASGLEQPIGLVNAGDDRLFVIQQRGLVRILDEEGNISETPFLDLSHKVSQSGFERGLLGLAFHPDHHENGYIYVNYTRISDGHTVVSRFSVDPMNANVADTTTEVQMLVVEQPYSNHNGGQVLFGPDGYLYIALGDGGSGGDPLQNGQNTSVLLGKMLRIDVNADNDSAYVIPSDNPFVDSVDARGEIWAYGLRNPWRSSFDRLTGDFWIADVGQNEYEEFNFQPAGSMGGENYGWRCFEATHQFDSIVCETDDMVFPVYEYQHVEGNCSGSVTGGYVYRGALYDGLYGYYIASDFCTGGLYTVRQTEDGFEGMEAGSLPAGEVTSFGEDQYGELYLVFQSAGNIYRVADTSGCSPVAQIMNGDSIFIIENDSLLNLSAIYNPALGYQWLKDGEPIEGATQADLEISEEGVYTVQVTNSANECSVVSAPVEVSYVTSAPELKELGQVKVYPNPAKDYMQIEGLPVAGKSNIVLYDVNGKTVLSKNSGDVHSVMISTTGLINGMYYLRIISNSEVFQQKVLINR